MTARIVVADDEVDIRRLISFTLRRRGHEVVEASAGDEALELIRREMPGLAVLDVKMPGLTGPAVIAALRSDAATRAIPAMLLSANGQAGEVAAGLASGAQDYLVKPFVPKDLARRAAHLLSSSAR